MTEELALINCRQKKEICGDAVIWDDLTFPETASSGVKSTSGNFTLTDKFNKDSICGGDSSNYGSITTITASDAIDCKAKCLLEGKTVCNNLLYIGTGSVCKAYSKSCNEATPGAGESGARIYAF